MGAGSARTPETSSPARVRYDPQLAQIADAARPPPSIPALLEALGHALQRVCLLLVVGKAAALLLPSPPLVRLPHLRQLL